MIKTKWILQTNIFKEKGVDEMIQAFKDLNIDYQLVKIIPFLDELPEGVKESYDIPIIGYGTTTLLRTMARYKGIFPGMWFNEDTYKPSIWGSGFGKHYLNKDSRIMKVKNVLKYWNGDRQFIRPNSDFKLFSGDVFHKGDFVYWFDNVQNTDYKLLNENTIVSVSPYKKIISEYRFFIVDREVIEGSRYKLMNRLNISRDIEPEAYGLASKIAKSVYQFNSAYVLDIAITETGPYVIEINCLNASGFYECNPKDIIYACSKLAEKEYYEKF